MTERFGNYEIIRKIAAGGMAEVYLAKQTGLGGFERLVCIKRILPHLGEQDEFIKMFQDEARIAANIVHPNIAQIYDIGEFDDSYYIAMEYVRGEDLRRVYNQEVSRGRAMPGEQAAQIVMYAAAGLDYAHRQTTIDGRPLGIVHRDISPQNVLISYDGHVKIVDFGVAKAQGKLAETRAGVLKGKYSYMSPEQAAGDPIDGRTDVFALGITLYEVTTGTRLFKRESEIETLHAVIECDVPRPRSVNPNYEAGLEEIVLTALAKNPSERFQTAGEMERALERHLIEAGLPTGASSLAGYMHDLFAEKLADELLFGHSESASASQQELPSDEAKPATRALTPSAASRRGGSHSQPDTVDDEATENTDAERSSVVAGSGSWPSVSGWGGSAASQVESRTRTQAMDLSGPQFASGAKEVDTQGPRKTEISHPSDSEMVFQPTRRPSAFIAIVLAGVIMSLVISVTLVLISKRNGPEDVPRSGPLVVDSEPRGARVIFSGLTSAELNERYGGYRTPFNIDEGIAVGAILRAEFVKDGFSKKIIDLPSVSEARVPPVLFAELVPDTKANRAVLMLTTTPPGADLYLSGNPVDGKTPLEEVEIPARELVRIEVRMQGYEPASDSVFAAPGDRVVKSYSLTPKEGSVGEKAVTPEPTPDEHPEPKDPPEGKKHRTVAKKGYLSVNAPLNLRIYLGNRSIGQAPTKRIALPVGTHRIRLENPSEGLVLSRRIRIKPGQTESIDLRLEKGNLAVQASPWANVTRGKQSVVQTPSRWSGLYEGDYRLRFECPDGKTFTKTVEVKGGSTGTAKVDCRAN